MDIKGDRSYKNGFRYSFFEYNMLPELIKFHYECSLSEIIDSRHTHELKIMDSTMELKIKVGAKKYN